MRERTALWPYWLILALVLNFLEVALRKGFFERLEMWWNKRSFARMAAPAGVVAQAANCLCSLKPFYRGIQIGWLVNNPSTMPMW